MVSMKDCTSLGLRHRPSSKYLALKSQAQLGKYADTGIRLGAGSLFRYDFDGANRRIINRRSEVDLDLSLRRRLDMVEGLNQRPPAAFPENVKALQEHYPIARNIEHAAANATGGAISDAEPMLQEIELQSVFVARHDGHGVVEVPVAMPFEKAPI